MRPTLHCALLFVAGIGAALLPALVAERLWTVWLAALALLLVATGLDAVLAPRPKGLAVSVRPPESLHVGVAGTLTLSLHAAGWARGADVSLVCETGPDVVPPPGGRAS